MLPFPAPAPDVHDHSSGGGGGLDLNLKNELPEPQRTANLQLLEDYPEPLTAEQKESLRRRTATLIHRYTLVRRGARLIDRGYKSLQSLLARLEAERSHLRKDIETMEKPGHAEAIQENTTKESGTVPPVAPVAEASEATAPVARPTVLRSGGLLRSAAFANLQGVLSAAKREERQQRSAVTLERERVAKMAQLKIVEADLMEQQQHLVPLTEKYEKSVAFLEAVRCETLEAVRLYDDLQRMEVAYPSRFFLRASGLRNKNQADEDNTGADETSTAGTFETVSGYDVFFAPVAYSEEVQDMIREQVDEGLEEYLTYRRRADPVLEALAEERRAREARRADQLVQLIGAGAEGAGEVPFVPATAAPAPGRRGGPVEVCRIGDSSDESDGGGEESAEEAESEEKQRGKIQTALAALDDFEELY